MDAAEEEDVMLLALQLHNLDFREPDNSRPSIVFRFLLVCWSTLTEAARQRLAEQIRRIFGFDNGIVYILLNNRAIGNDISFEEVDEITNGMFQILMNPPPLIDADFHRPVGHQPGLRRQGVPAFVPNRVQVICGFMTQLVASFDDPVKSQDILHRLFEVFGRPINANIMVNVQTIQQIGELTITSIRDVPRPQ